MNKVKRIDAKQQRMVTIKHQANRRIIECTCNSLEMHSICVDYLFRFTPPSSGVSGSGKTFTCDRLIIKMFSESAKSEWLQDIRKVCQKALRITVYKSCIVSI